MLLANKVHHKLNVYKFWCPPISNSIISKHPTVFFPSLPLQRFCNCISM